MFQETRRRQQLDAVEKRLQQQEYRGIKDPDKVRRQQQRKEEMEKREEEAARLNQTPGLKVRFFFIIFLY
jgi:small VCP/p97-interacting protein